MSKRVTILEFDRMFGTDEKCLEDLFIRKYGDTKECPKCGKEFNYKKINGRNGYQCTKCRNQIYPLSKTPFAKSKIPLKTIYKAIYVFSNSKSGFSALQLQRNIGGSYKTSWGLLHKIRELLKEDRLLFEKLQGVVQIDCSYVGGKVMNFNARKRQEYRNRVPVKERGLKNKATVFGMVDNDGVSKAYVVEGETKEAVYPVMKKHVKKSTVIYSDQAPAYLKLKEIYPNMQALNKYAHDYSKNHYYSTNKIENLWTSLKRTLAMYISVSDKYLQNYVNEVVFKYNHRKSLSMCMDMLECLTRE